MNSLTHDGSQARPTMGMNLGHKQLPIWPETVRGGPNAILRSALFAGIQSKKRQTLDTQSRPDKKPEGVAIASQDGIQITFAGTQFNQYDADVFFETLHRARRQSLETACQFKGADFLKSIGRSCNNLSYEDLEESLDRLRRGSIDLEWEVSGRRYKFSGSLIAYYMRETTTKAYKVTFAKEILTLFAPASWTQLEWDERQAIKGKPLAQWLHNPELCSMLERATGKPVHLMPRGVDTELFTPARRDRPAGGGPLVLGYVGRLSVEKNVLLLTRVEQKLIERGITGFEFLIIGQGNEEASLRANLRHAHFTGVLRGAELGRAYANMDVLLFPSHTDTFGNVVLEALASGVPAVVTQGGGPKYIVREGETGYVTEDGGFAERIERLIRNPAEHATMREASRSYALGCSWDAVFSNVYSAYRNALPASFS